MAVSDIFQVTIGCRFGDQLGLNVRHYRSVASTGPGPISPQLFADELFDRLDATYIAILTSSSEFRGVIVQKILPLPAGMGFLSSQDAIAGSQTGDPLPRQVSGLISLRTDFSGRRFRGRAYIPFPPETLSEADATPTAFYLAGLADIAQAMVEPLGVTDGGSTETWLPVIFHRDSGTTDFITSAMVHDAWATQRRRGSFGRPNALLGGGSPIVPIGP